MMCMCKVLCMHIELDRSGLVCAQVLVVHMLKSNRCMLCHLQEIALSAQTELY